jgi:hypothetical protein
VYPKLPGWLYSQLGPVKVESCDLNEHPSDEILMGQYLLEFREIQVDQNLCEEQEWQTLFHEMVHMVVLDAGLDTILKDSHQEAICDAIGTYLASAVANGFLEVIDDPVSRKKEGK